MSTNEEIKQDNATPEETREIIFSAELVNKTNIEIINKTSHIPTLSYIAKLLDSEIIEIIMANKIKDSIKNRPKIIPSNGGGGGLENFRNLFRKKK